MPLGQYLFAREWQTMAKSKTSIFNLTHDCITIIMVLWRQMPLGRRAGRAKGGNLLLFLDNRKSEETFPWRIIPVFEVLRKVAWNPQHQWFEARQNTETASWALVKAEGKKITIDLCGGQVDFLDIILNTEVHG